MGSMKSAGSVFTTGSIPLGSFNTGVLPLEGRKALPQHPCDLSFAASWISERESQVLLGFVFAPGLWGISSKI